MVVLKWFLSILLGSVSRDLLMLSCLEDLLCVTHIWDSSFIIEFSILGRDIGFLIFFLSMNTHSSLICNSQRLETTQMFTTRRKGKQTAIAVYEEDDAATNRSALRTHSAVTLCGRKAGRRRHRRNRLTQGSKSASLSMRTKSRLWVHGDGKEEGWGSYWWKQESLGSDGCSYEPDCADILKGVKHVKCIKWNTVNIKFTIYQL